MSTARTTEIFGIPFSFTDSYSAIADHIKQTQAAHSVGILVFYLYLIKTKHLKFRSDVYKSIIRWGKGDKRALSWYNEWLFVRQDGDKAEKQVQAHSDVLTWLKLQTDSIYYWHGGSDKGRSLMLYYKGTNIIADFWNWPDFRMYYGVVYSDTNKHLKDIEFANNMIVPNLNTPDIESAFPKREPGGFNWPKNENDLIHDELEEMNNDINKENAITKDSQIIKQESLSYRILNSIVNLIQRIFSNA